MTEVPNEAWLTAMVRHEGFPMALRVRPNLSTPENHAAYPALVALEHHLDSVRTDGLPEPEYNEQLAELDDAIVEMLTQDDQGIVAIVETFAGKRTYYSYLKAPAPAEQWITELRQRHPAHRLHYWRGGADGWELYEDYQQQFGW